MDLKIDWSPEAVEDLESIADYIGRDSEFYARAVVTRVLDVCSGLIKFPYIGRMVPEHGDENIRERIVYSYAGKADSAELTGQSLRYISGSPGGRGPCSEGCCCLNSRARSED